jgi:hypothetical protein
MPDNNKGVIPNTKKIEQPKPNIASLFVLGQAAATSDIIGQSGAISDAYGNTDFGESKYDEPTLDPTFITSGDYKYNRGERQSIAEKWGVGLSRAAVKLGTRTLNGVVSPIYGVGSALKNWDVNKLIDNEVTRANQAIEEGLDAAMPLYSTKAEEDATGLSKLAYANTWAGSILDGISYSGAAMLSGSAYAKAFSAAAKLSQLDKLGMSVAEAMGAATKIEDAADKTKFVIELTNKAKKLKNGLNNGTIAMIGASTEASSEAMSTGDEFERQMLAKIEAEEGGISDEARARVKELKKSVMNSTYALQIPVIAGSNWLTFGKTMLGSTATEKLLAKTAARTEKDVATQTYKASVVPTLQKIIDKSYGIRQVTGKAIPEGFEEWEQLAVTKGVNDYYSKKYYNPTYDDFYKSMASGINDAMSQEGLENFMVGAISGGIFGNATQIKTEGFKSYKNPINDASVNAAVDYLNSIKGSDAFKEQVQTQYRHANLSEQQDQAITANNDFEIQNNKSDMFINYVNHMVNAGKTQDLREELESYKQVSDQEFEEILGVKLSNDALTNHKESVNSYIQKRLNKIDKIEQLSNSIDELHPNLTQDIKDRFMYTAWTLEDAQDRVKNLTKEINFKLSDNLTTANVVAVNMLQDFPTLDKEARQNALATINSSLQISPLLKQEILKKVNDLDKLVDRQEQFIAEYKALENPKLQAKLEEVDQIVEDQVNDAVHENEAKEQSKPVKPPVTEQSIPTEQVVNEQPVEEQTLTEDQVIAHLGDKIINRKSPEEVFTPEEQQYYENNKEAVEAYVASKANINSQSAGYADIALDYLFTGGKDTILSTDYLLQALVGGFPKAAIEINNIRNKYADKLGNIKDDINSDIYNKTMQEIRNVINKNYNNLKALEILDKILKNPTGFTTKEGRQVEIELDNLNQPEVTTPEVEVPEVKSTSDKHQVLNTPANGRDTELLKDSKTGLPYVDKDGKTHSLGEYRNNPNNGLDSFEEVRKALEFLTVVENPQSLISFVEQKGFIMLQVAGVNVSTISKYGGSPEQKAINALFYNQDGSPKSIESITELFNRGVIQLDLTKHLNTLLKDDVKPTLTEVLPMLYEEADTVKFRDNNTDISLEGESQVTEYDPALDESRENLSNLQSDITEGLHIEIVVDGRMDVIKVKTKTHDNPQQPFEQVVADIFSADGDAKQIQASINNFNNSIFFALEPIEGVVREFKLNYAASTNTFYFTLHNKDKGTNARTPQPLPAKLKNIHPSNLSVDLVVEELSNTPINANTQFTAKNIRYSSIINEEGETDTNKLEVYIDPNGLFKYGVQFSINAEAKPLAAEVTPMVETKPIETVKSEVKEEPKTFEELLKQVQDEAKETSDPDEVYAIGLEESTGITPEEIESIKKILPRFISIEDIKTIANNLKVKGIPYGVFKNKVIYLNTTKGKPGTAYHEAFHAVFRTMLTNKQIEKYYSAALVEFKKSGKNMKQEVSKLQETIANYANKSQQELEALVLEEYMADKFMDYAKGKNAEESSNLLKQLFFKIKNFFKELFNIGEELDMLYANIMKGKFANSEGVYNSYFNASDSVFKLLPKKNSSQENGFFNAQDSRKIISYFAIQIYKARKQGWQDAPWVYKNEPNAEGKYEQLSDEELLDFFILERLDDLDTKGVAYAKSVYDSRPDLAKELLNKIEAEKYLYNKDNVNNIKLKPYDVLKSAVSDKLSVFKFKTSEEAVEEQEGGEEATHMKDTFGSQDSFLNGGHDSLSQTIKKYVAFTTRIEKDEITNEDREVGIDEVALYNGLTSILADTNEDRMIAKLYDASESNSNIKAFYEQIITDLGISFDPETRTTSYPTDPEASNITRALLTNFKNSKATQIDVLVGETWTKDEAGNSVKTETNTWTNANKNDAKKISLERWKTRVTYISRLKSIKEFQHNFSEVNKVYNNYIKGYISLDKAVQDVEKTGKKGIKELLDTNGITLTSIYIKISLAKQKALLNPDKLSIKDKNFISIYDTTEPMDFKMFGAAALNDGFSIIDVIDKDLKALFDEKDGVLGRLSKLAENNAKFDETIANFSFTNAENKKVYEIIKPSYVLSRPELYKKDSYWESVEKGEGLNEIERMNTHFLKTNYLVTKHKDLLKNLKINILSGFRDTTTQPGKKAKDGVTFGSFDARTYLLSAITLFHNKGNKNTGMYMFRQNEASSTGYVAELPKIDTNTPTGQQEVANYFLNQVKAEWNRIKREKKAFDKKPGEWKKYNDSLKGRAFDFTEFQYLRDTLGKTVSESNELYEALVKSALDTEVKELTAEQITAINAGVKTYLDESFNDFIKTIDANQIRLFLKPDMKVGQASYEAFLRDFYINDYIMSNSLNELMDGDYALSRKDKVDISKRNKGAMASGPDFGRGQHTSAVIKDIDLFTSTVLIDNKIVRVKPEFDGNGKLIQVTNESGKVLELTKEQIASYTSNDAMSYASQYHMMMAAFRLGRTDGRTRQAYKDIIQFTKKVDGKVVRNVNIGDSTQKHLAEALASLNSKKTIVFDGINGQYLKMSELGFIRSSISYIEDKDVDSFVELTDTIFDLMSKDDYESNEFRDTVKKLGKLYKPVPGMEYWHNLANNMDLHGIDHLAVESASKGATRNPQDSKAEDLDLSKSKTNVLNANKRLQVETPTGKKEIVTGSQVLTLIASELNDDYEVNGVKLGQLRKEYNDAIAGARENSFKKAIKIIELNSNGTIDKSKLDDVVKRALAASGADEQLLEFFDVPMNYNMIQMIVKAEQTILSYFSKGVLNQKVNGDKVSLVSDAGVKVVRDIETGKVISHHEIVKNPAKYANTAKYTQSALIYNVEEGDLKYSECMLSQTILTRHGLKIGDTITPEMTEVMKSLGYRIPTGDKQSAMSLKVVSLLPDYYNGIGIFPSEIVHLSGADFDIDSEFIQMPYFWYKKSDPTVPIKYGTEKSDDDKFEGFKFYNKNLNKDFSRVYKQFLNQGYDVITAYEETSKQLKLPYTKKDFIKSGIKSNPVLNNIALDRMISMLANNSTAEIANNTTSTDVLSQLVPKMKKDGFIKSSESKIKQKNKSASDINGKFDSNSKNSAGKDGIGIAANKIQQFALLMSKVGNKEVIFDEESFRFEVAGEKGGKYSVKNAQGERIANNLNILLNVFTDNAKDPIAGELNIQFELLGGFTELIMQGMSFENAVKFINLPLIQEYGKIQKSLKSKIKTQIEESFSKKTAHAAAIMSLETEGKVTKKGIEVINADKSKIDPKLKEVTLDEINAILLGKETNMEAQYQALSQFIKVQDQYNVMATVNTFLTLNQGLDTSFTELNYKLHKAIDTWKLNDEFKTADRGLSVGTPHIDLLSILKDDANTYGNINRALEVSKKVGQKIFIEQTELFTKEFDKLKDSLKEEFSTVADNISDVSREFLGYLSVKAYVDNLEKLKNDINTKEANKQAIQKRLDSLNLGLIFNNLNKEGQVNLVSQLELLKSNEVTKDNYIVKYFTIKENIIDTKSFVKESNETISLLIDSVKTLWMDNTTKLNEAGLTPRNFVDNMLSYLMVKDNMTFKNNSVAKYLPVNMFGKYSETLDALVEGLVTKNVDMNFAEAGYNFRKLYVTDVNTTFNAMQTLSVNTSDNNGIKLNGENLEFGTNTNSVGTIETSNKALKSLFNTLPVESETFKNSTFKFPQFIKVRLNGGEYKIYELTSFTNHSTGFSKKDDFLNYIDATQGVNHNTANPYAAGEQATYKPLDQIGLKGTSVFFPGTYELAKAKFAEAFPVTEDTTTTEEPLIKLRPQVETTEVNAVNVEIVKEKALPIVKIEEKVVPLVDQFKLESAKLKLIDYIAGTDLYLEGKLFSDKQYELLKQRISNVKSISELEALVENINNCM